MATARCIWARTRIALAPFTDTIAYLEDGDWVVLTRKGATIYDSGRRGRASRVPSSTAAARSWSTRATTATSWPRRSTSSRKSSATRWRVTSTWRPSASPAGQAAVRLQGRSSASRSSACGTAYYAGLVAKYWIERFARLPVEIDVASEFRYREAPLRKGGLAIFISQSGETADTLASLRYAKEQGAATLAVVNVPTSTIARESERCCRRWPARDRRRLDQGVHLPARGAGLRSRSRPAARAANCPTRDEGSLVRGLIEMPRPDGRGADARAADREARARYREKPRRALSRPRHHAFRSRSKAR